MAEPKQNKRLRVLCIDIEGGYGGSSRSLYESVRFLNRSEVEVEIWCGKSGPIQRKYQDIGAPCHVTSKMPRFNSLPRLSRSAYTLAIALVDFLRSRDFRTNLVQAINDGFDIVHFNHESLFILARWLRSQTDVPFTMHIRTRPIKSVFARWQTRTISRTIDCLAFITENERDNFLHLGGKPLTGSVIHNIATAQSIDAANTSESTAALLRDPRLKVVSLSNYVWVRGVDRLVDIAAELSRLGHRDVVFVVAGDLRLTKSLPGDLGRVGRRGGTLRDYVSCRKLDDMFIFLGHVDTPEQVLAACDALIKPTREYNPWSRDILEGLAAGLPVISYGSYNKFVEHGVTGVLRERFDATETAVDILALADDPERCRRMGEAGRARVAELCNGPARAAELLAFWRAALVQS